MTLKTKPTIPVVRSAPPVLAATISTPAFISICSENMIPTTEHGEPGAVSQREVGAVLLELGLDGPLAGTGGIGGDDVGRGWAGAAG